MKNYKKKNRYALTIMTIKQMEKNDAKKYYFH
jgi:hypothetical protein